MRTQKNIETITSCTITWDNWGLVYTEDILNVTTRILSNEIQVRFYNGHGLIGGSIWPLDSQQKQELFGLLDKCREEWEQDDYSVSVCDGCHWKLKICAKGRCLRSVEGTAELPPHGREIRELVAKIIGDENCFIFYNAD